MKKIFMYFLLIMISTGLWATSAYAGWPDKTSVVICTGTGNKDRVITGYNFKYAETDGDFSYLPINLYEFLPSYGINNAKEILKIVNAFAKEKNITIDHFWLEISHESNSNQDYLIGIWTKHSSYL